VAYCTPEDLRTVLGGAVDTDAQAVSECCDAAKLYVDATTGATFAEGANVDPRVKRAAMLCAVRIYREPEAPWGIVGGFGDVPMYAKGAFPDVDALLLGLHARFGVA
jgi:hypothetical protein